MSENWCASSPDVDTSGASTSASTFWVTVSSTSADICIFRFDHETNEREKNDTHGRGCRPRIKQIRFSLSLCSVGELLRQPSGPISSVRISVSKSKKFRSLRYTVLHRTSSMSNERSAEEEKARLEKYLSRYKLNSGDHLWNKAFKLLCYSTSY